MKKLVLFSSPVRNWAVVLRDWLDKHGLHPEGFECSPEYKIEIVAKFLLSQEEAQKLRDIILGEQPDAIPSFAHLIIGGDEETTIYAGPAVREKEGLAKRLLPINS